MPYVILDYRDGGYGVRPLTDDEADQLMQQGHEVVLVEDRVLKAWFAHCDQDAAFNTMWRALDNERALRIELQRKPREPANRIGKEDAKRLREAVNADVRDDGARILLHRAINGATWEPTPEKIK